MRFFAITAVMATALWSTVALARTLDGGPASPSAAPTLKVGVPYTSGWDSNSFHSWMRLPFVLHPKDTVQIAFSNNDGFDSASLCVVAPVDDYGADAALGACYAPTGDCSVPWACIRSGHKVRVVMPYAGRTGQPFLVSQMCRPCNDPKGTFTVIVERRTVWFAVGWTNVSHVTRALLLVAFVRYGDNSPAANGTPVVLSWRSATSPKSPWQKLGAFPTSGGKAKLRATLPTSTKGTKVILRACAGSGARGCAFNRVSVS